MRFLDQVEATFVPVQSDDLMPGVDEWIGRRLVWTAGWEIEDGPHRGQWAMLQQRNTDFPAAWVPACDLAEVVTV